jgi:hypothetical protein
VLVAVLASGLSGLASIVYAGVLDHASDAWHRGEDAPTHGEVAAKLPWGALALASLLLASFVGLLEVVTTHLLVRAEG